ncbi:MAG: hypothetical protein IPK83_00255 [Planctomycetes bacterium]|nr:hypothetical protein [Planctomycetota bacterium]
MSVLTKVFTILLVLLSVVLSAFTVAAFSQQENWKASASDWREAALAEQAKSRSIAANAALESQNALARHLSDLDEINKIKAEVADKERSLAKLESDYAAAQNQLSVEQSTVNSTSEHNKLLENARNRDGEFIAKLSRRNSELERLNVDLNDRVKELTSSVAMAQSQIRALRQQIETMSGDQIAGVTQIPGSSGVQTGIPSVAPSSARPIVTSPIRGEVTEVKDGLASISVGSTDGVAEGMTFLLYRPGVSGSKPLYLGTLRVTRVEANNCAGTLETTEGQVQPGDLARDEASFALRG